MYIRKNKRGQSTVEYVLLMTAVVAVIITLVAGNGSVFQTKLNSTLNTAMSDMSDGAGILSNSHAAQPANASSGNSTPPYTVNIIP